MECMCRELCNAAQVCACNLLEVVQCKSACSVLVLFTACFAIAITGKRQIRRSIADLRYAVPRLPKWPGLAA